MIHPFFEAVLIRAVDPSDLVMEMKRLSMEGVEGAPSVDFVIGYAQALFLMRAIGDETWSHLLEWSMQH